MIVTLLAALLTGATPTEKIAVMDVVPRGDVSPRVAQVVTDDVLSEVRRRNPDVSVIGAEEVRALLGAQAERVPGRTRSACHTAPFALSH